MSLDAHRSAQYWHCGNDFVNKAFASLFQAPTAAASLVAVGIAAKGRSTHSFTSLAANATSSHFDMCDPSNAKDTRFPQIQQ